MDRKKNEKKKKSITAICFAEVSFQKEDIVIDYDKLHNKFCHSIIPDASNVKIENSLLIKCIVYIKKNSKKKKWRIATFVYFSINAKPTARSTWVIDKSILSCSLM